MESFIKLAPYLKDPLVLVGFFIFLAFLLSRQLLKSGIIGPIKNVLGFRILRLIISYGFVIGLFIIAIGGFLKYVELNPITTNDVARAVQSETKDIPREVDFGVVDLPSDETIDALTPIPSYKYNHQMSVYGGEDFEFHVISAGESFPQITLVAGNREYPLHNAEGKIKIVGPINQPMRAFFRMQTSGLARPVSVKVQVTGVERS